ncbi:MAG: GNAT family N-acetyltransferase [Pirellulaceae bacterium]|nr:GNAT family N-acetyltransferase [Pirellulaceae bacterium]
MSHDEYLSFDSTELSEEAIPQPNLTTERLTMRPFWEADAEQVQSLLQCREIAANTISIEHPYPAGAARIWINTHQKKWQGSEAAIFAICENTNTHTPVGAIGLEINAKHENAELGYWIGESWWGRGYCTEAAQALVDFGFSTLGLKKIHAHFMAKNPASGRVLRKIGMEKEGHMKSHIKKWGIFEDVIFFGTVRS